jgi:hypothetical protein
MVGRLLLLGVVCLLQTSCRPAVPAGGSPSAKTQTEEPDAPSGEEINDPVLREARAQVETILSGLLAGQFDKDPDLWPVASKLKNFQAYSIKSQKIIREGAAQFKGLLRNSAGRAHFDLMLVKQTSGKWAVATFSGPNPE